MAEFWIKSGDTLPRIESTLTDGSGSPVDIAQADVFFTLRMIDAPVAVISLAEASNDQVDDGSDGSRGFVHYDWTTGDTDVAGGFYAEWQVEFASGGIMTFPNNGYDTVAITDQLESAS